MLNLDSPLHVALFGTILTTVTIDGKAANNTEIPSYLTAQYFL